MYLLGFLQNRDGVKNNFLSNCLNSLARCCDNIVVYDDASDEDVRSLYKQFDCSVIFGTRRAFARELYHKQELLKVAMMYHPDAILWHDSDAVLGRHWESRERAEKTISSMIAQEIDLLHLHNVNHWRTPWYYRVDQSFDALDHGVVWRNTGELHYVPVAKLHQKQYPQFWRDPERPIMASKFAQEDGQLLHFGFASDEEIARKYFTYREHGQTGWALDRLVDEKTLELKPAQKEWFPTWLLPQIGEPGEMPKPEFTPENMREYRDFQHWLGTRGAR